MIPCLLAMTLGLSLGDNSAQPPAPRTIRVLCYNVHHGEGTDGKVDLPRLAGVIKAAKPDLVALQEVDHKTRRTGGVDQTAELARLTGLNGKFGKAIDYQGGEYGQSILSRSPMSDLKVYQLPGMPDREQRIAVETRVRWDGQELSFVTTHLHHANPKFREQQAAKLNELFADVERPVILAGDLNATPDSKPLQLLRSKWKIANDDKSLLSFPAGKPTKQIDYVLVRPGKRFRVLEQKVIAEPIASDHRPVLVVLELLSK